MSSKFDKIVDVINRISSLLETTVLYLCMIVLTIMTIFTLYVVFIRYVLGGGIAWATELTRYMLVFISMFGVALALKQNDHVGLELVVKKMSKFKQYVIEHIVNLILLIFSSILAYEGYKFAITTEVKGEILPINMRGPHFIVFFSALLLIVFLIERILDNIYRWRQ